MRHLRRALAINPLTSSLKPFLNQVYINEYDKFNFLFLQFTTKPLKD